MNLGELPKRCLASCACACHKSVCGCQDDARWAARQAATRAALATLDTETERTPA